MSGTKAGGAAAAATNKKRYGSDYYAKIGSKGAKLGTTGGFASKAPCKCSVYEWTHRKAECAGAIGGAKSRRKYAK